MQMSGYYYNYFFLFVFVLVAILFPLLPIMLAKVVAPKKPSHIKNAAYECGIESKGTPWVQYQAQYYLIALVFVIFDVEIIFIYPWAIAYRHLGLIALVEMLIFISMLLIGLIYAWKKGVLDWK